MRFRALLFPIVMFAFSIGLSAQGIIPVINAPDAVLHDSPFTVTVTGLTPGTAYTFRAEMCTHAGTVWRSEAEFRADAAGTIDLSRDKPVSGSYEGVDPIGPFWSMQKTPERSDNASLFSNFDQTPVVIQIREGEKSMARKIVTLRMRDIGISTVEIRGDVAGTFFSPTTLKGRRVPGVIVLPGSEGGVPRPNAALVASHGYPTLALAYFGFEKLPGELERIPIETVDRAVAWLSTQPGVDPERIVLMGGSKGAELALLAASLNKRVSAVIAISPSSVVYEGIGSSKGQVSSWTYKGAELPFAPYVRSEKYAQSRRLIDLYDPTFDGAPESSRIAAEKISGPILLISGKADTLWPSARMADEIAGRLKSKGFKYEVNNLQFDDVGHHASGIPLRPTGDSVRLGGTARSIGHAQVEAWRAIDSFLSNLKK
jgi:dienelactone hydrolase